MNYMLDTHILLWVRFSPEKLTKTQKTIIESPDKEKFISAVTAWEISLKYSLGKLDLGGDTPEVFIAGLQKVGIKSITPTQEQYATFYLLPKVEKHKDPFDRMIIWHAMNSGLTLISSDKKLSGYKLHGLRLI
jgi:PIN domain nuclease of toxin-antitoxin system